MKIRILITGVYLLFSVALGLLFLLYDGHYTFGQLKHFRGFWLSWASSTGITFLAMCGVDYLTRMLHKRWPWGRTWPQRLGLQLSLGLLLPMAVVLAWNAHFFYSQHQLGHLEQYFDSEYELAGIFLVLFNALCCCALLAWPLVKPGTIERDGPGLVDEMTSPEETEIQEEEEAESPGEEVAEPSVPASKDLIDVADLIQNGAFIAVSGRICVVYRFDNSKEYLTKPLKEMERLLAGPFYCRIHRNHMVNRKAIRERVLDNHKHSCIVKLHEPYADGKYDLKVGQKYLKAFLEWWDLKERNDDND